MQSGGHGNGSEQLGDRLADAGDDATDDDTKSASDHLLRVLVRVVLTYAGFLESSSDDELDPDTAVKQLEDLAATLHELDTQERAAFVTLLCELAEEEETAAGKQWVLALPQMFGLTE